MRVFLLLMLVSSPCFAEIYQWVDENGKVQFSDRNPKDQQAQVFETSEINSYTNVSYESVLGKNKTDRLVMYSAEWCGVCTRAKSYMRQNNISFVERDIDKSSSAKKAYDRLGGTGVPIFIYGDQRMNGFSAGRIELWLADSESP